jgi:hypothetical protein
MATQKYRSRLDKTVGENRGSPTKVPGHGQVAFPKGGENKTPSPTGPVTTPDAARSTSWGRSSGAAGDNSGKQGYGGPSSVNPGERPGPATVNPQASTDRVLDALISGGVAALDASDDWQTRRLDDTGDKNLKASSVHPAMAKRGVDSGSPGGTVPAKNGNPTSDWDARRAAALKQAK